MFSGGTSARMLCTCWKTKPPPCRRDLDLVLDMPGMASGVPCDSSHWVSQPPPQKVMSLPKSRFKPPASMPFAADLHRIDGIEAGFDKVRQEEPYVATGMQHHLDVGQLLCALPHPRVAGLEELTVHPGRDLGAVLHAEIVVEDDDVDVWSDQPEVLLQSFFRCNSVKRSSRSWARTGSAASRARKLSFR